MHYIIPVVCQNTTVVYTNSPQKSLRLYQNSYFVFKSTTKMNNEKLIEAVREHEVLYDLSHAKYIDDTCKDAIWKAIGKDLQQESNTFQNNIKKLKKYIVWST